jgi:hypothetical protein
LWVFPKYKDIRPRYDQKTFDPAERKNAFQEIISPLESSGTGVKINQDAYMYLSAPDAKTELNYSIKKDGNGIYLFVLEGTLSAGGEKLNKRDGAGITDTEEVRIVAETDAEFLLIEIPMN